MKRTPVLNKLPEGILMGDLVMPKNKDGYSDWDALAGETGERLQFEMWYTTGFGWCIPTLNISPHNRRVSSARTYAVRVDTDGVVRIGGGPHVIERHWVYVKKARLKALQKYVDMQAQGAVDANTVRDRISSRRAQGALNRAKGLTSWRW